MLELKYIEPVNLHEAWDIIKEGLVKVRKHGDHWKAEDVYAALKTGQAHLHLGLMPDYVGFIITQQQQSYDGNVLHLWACYSTQPKSENILEIAFPTLEEWARAINAKRITFSSPRRGWEKNTLGFKTAQIIYEKSL